MPHSCPGCHQTFDAQPLAGLLCCPRCARHFDARQAQTQQIPAPMHAQAQSEAPSAARYPVASAGMLFNQYRLIRQLGQGGMAEVWLATDTQLENAAPKQDHSPVVIKILHQHSAAQQELRKRFAREISSLERLQHPQIIPIIDHGVAQQRPYYVSNMQASMSLRDVMVGLQKKDGKKISAHFLQRVANDCLQALAHAHGHNIIHRDVKPENILLLPNKTFALADFGIAQLQNTEQQQQLTMLTNTNAVLGTYAYMAPEQSRSSKNVDGRADLYALGVILYECISGHLPAGRFEDPSHFLQHWSRSDTLFWNTFILCLLERDPQKRYPSASAALIALQRAALALPVTVEPSADKEPSAGKEHSANKESSAGNKPPTHLYPHSRRLYRHSSHGWLGGICSGLAIWSGIDASWIRLAACLGVIWSAGILGIIYLLAWVFLPRCPDLYYHPKALNANLPQRGHGWFLGVCDLFGQHLAAAFLWRIVIVLICCFYPLPGLIAYLFIGILFPPASSHHAHNASAGATAHTGKMPATEKRGLIPAVKNTTPTVLPLWPNYGASLIGAAGLALSAYLSYQHQQTALAAMFAGLCFHFISRLQARTAMTPTNFTGIASGLVIGAGSILAVALLLQFNTPETVTLHQQRMLYQLAAAGCGLALLWSVLRGYYGALALILGLCPAICLLFINYTAKPLALVHAFSHFNVQLLHVELRPATMLPAALILILAAVLWLISARICQTLLTWVINPSTEATRHYNLGASIICLAVLISGFFFFA